MQFSDAPPSKRRREPSGSPPVLTMSCLGRLGQWGNQLFQYAFLRVLADALGHEVRCPAWLGATVFATGDAALAASAPQLPVVADRVVLSHQGWRVWASRHEPLRSLNAAAGVDMLSGKKLRAQFPQVWGAALSEPAECAAACGDVDLWGWFQFHTSAWAPHAPRLAQLFAPAPPLEAALRRLLAALQRGADAGAPLYVVHLRMGAGAAAVGGGGGGEAGGGGGGGEAGGGGEGGGAGGAWGWSDWEDRNTFWPAPIGWYVSWLSEAVGARRASERLRGGKGGAAAAGGPGVAQRPRPAVLVCSDDEKAAAELRRRLPDGCVPLAWEHVAASDEARALERAWAGLFDEGGGEGGGEGASSLPSLSLFRDWWAMTQADVLATSNSTFSFTAAMMLEYHARRRAEETTQCRCVRPVPEARRLEPFDPWDSRPLLACTDEQAGELYGGAAGSYGHLCT